MPRAFPREFKQDVLRVARDRGPGMSIKQISKDFGISASCLQRWLRQEAVDTGVEPGLTTDQAAGRTIAEHILDALRSCPSLDVAHMGRTLREWRDGFLSYCDTRRQQLRHGGHQRPHRSEAPQV